MRQTFTEFENHDEGLHLVGEDRVDDYARTDRRLPTMLLTVVAMVLFAGGLWFAYVQGTHHPAVTPVPGSAVPLLRADDRPTKVKPDQPGGMTIPDQNVSLYNEKPGGPPVEKLLPAPEQPLPRTAPTAKEAAPGSTPPASQQSDKAAPKPARQSRQAALAKQSPPVSRGAAVQVQLGSLRSPEAARDEWARLKRENADLLGKLTAVAVRTDLGEKGIYYRILAGSFGDAAAAEKLCSELKHRDFGCTVAR